MTRAVPAFGVAVRVAAAAIWLLAGATKAVNLTLFQAQVEQYRFLPHALEAPFAYGLPFVELFIGAYLLLGLLTRAAGVAACCLMCLFLIAQAQAWARGLNLDCGCFGTLTHERVGAGTIARDVGLAIPSLAMALFPARTLSLDRSLLGLPDRFRRSTPRRHQLETQSHPGDREGRLA